jgi:hypothetical protein
MDFNPEGSQSKRRFPRRRFARSVGFLFNGEHFVGMGEQIGEGGISFVLPNDFPISRQAVVSFQILNGSFICVRAEIRNTHVDPNTGHTVIGCLFKSLKFDQKREIRSYVSARTEAEEMR